MFFTLRRAPFCVALLLIAAAGGLAALLVHDGVGSDHGELASAALGDKVQAKGLLLRYNPPPGTSNPARWAPVLQQLGNDTYILEGTPADLLVLVRADGEKATIVGPVVVTGTETLRIAHPDQPWRTLVVIQADSWDPPIVFG